jgi:hypothetical protein
MRAQRLITDAEFVAQKTELADRRCALQARADPGTFSPQQLSVHLDEITEPLTHLRRTWNTLPMALRPRFHQLLLPVGFVNGKVGTAELGPLFNLFRQFAGVNSAWVALTGKSWNHIEREVIAFTDFFRETREAERVSGGAVRT